MITDDNSLVERILVDVHCTETGARNIKLTTLDDLELAKMLINGEENV